MSSEAPPHNQEEPGGFDAFFRRSYGKNLARTQKEFRLSRHDAEDVCSKAYAEVAQYWGRIRDPDGLLWARTCLRALDHFRKKERRPEDSCDPTSTYGDLMESSDPSPEKRFQIRQDLDDAMNLISQLPKQDQRVLMLDGLDYSGPELGRALQVSPGAARVRLHRAKQRLSALRKKEAEGQ